MAPRAGSLEGVALILDFGAVVSFSVFERHAATERRLGLPIGSIEYWGPLDPGRDTLWQAMLDGELTERNYWERFARDIGERVGERWGPAEFLRAARSPNLNEEIRPEVTALVDRAKRAGAALGILSNELELFYGAEALAEIRLLAEFDAIVDATHTKILKPDPRAYGQILAELGVEASRSVFLDDQPRNVAGGRDAGLTSIFFDVRDPVGSCKQAWSALQDLAHAPAD